MELGTYSERQRQRDPLNVELETSREEAGVLAAFSHHAAASDPRLDRSSRLRSAFAGGWLGDRASGAAEDRDSFSVGGYSPYDVAYRGQAHGGSGDPFGGERHSAYTKTSRIALLLTGAAIAATTAYFFLRRPGLQAEGNGGKQLPPGDPCVVEKSPECAIYPFFDGFNPDVVRLLDANTTTSNLLFRTSMPLDPNTKHLALEDLKAAAARQAEKNALSFPADPKVIFFTFQWDGANGMLLERCEVAREACDARTHSGVGTVHWPIYGQNVSPYSLPPEIRNSLARNFTQWDGDTLEEKVEVLRRMVHVSLEDNAAMTVEGHSFFVQEESGKTAGAETDTESPSLRTEKKDPSKEGQRTRGPLVSFIHCHHGQDRTGAVAAAYKMRYLGFSLDAVFRENAVLGQHLTESVNSMMWYCLYLQTKLGLSSTQCYDVVSANPAMHFAANGMAPKVPPGVLPASLPAFDPATVSVPGTDVSSSSASTSVRAPLSGGGIPAAAHKSKVVAASPEKSVRGALQKLDVQQPVPGGAQPSPAVVDVGAGSAGASRGPSVSLSREADAGEKQKTDGSLSPGQDGGSNEESAPAESLARVPPVLSSSGVESEPLSQ
ncbi:transmembrane [Cystoisospora suis]|uniref:Transmembrane n=1 Tax=Cystoisospora suis TaxID=483139 RepID=A0A2C6LFC1_9APIC|nr:transmembrane [Cystoisospora suis]